jgi:hypothetical protein
MERGKVLVVFHSLGFMQRPVIRLLRQLVDTPLQAGIRPKIDNLPSGFRCEAFREGFDQPVK